MADAINKRIAKATADAESMPLDQASADKIKSLTETVSDIKEESKKSPEETKNALGKLRQTITRKIRLNKGVLNLAKETQEATEQLEKELEELPEQATPVVPERPDVIPEPTPGLENGAPQQSGAISLLGTVGAFGGKVMQFINDTIEKLKPHLSKLAATPGIAFLLGEANVKKLQEFLGGSEEIQKLQEEITDRLPKGVSFQIADRKELTAFKDVYNKMLEKKNTTPEKYSKGDFFRDIRASDHLKIGTKTAVKMDEIVEAAQKLIKETEPAPATTPVTPPAAPVTPPVATPPATPTK